MAELNEVLDQLRQGPSPSPQRVSDTTGTSGNEAGTGGRRRLVFSKKIYKMKRVYAADKIGQFYVTGPNDASSQPCQLFCWVWFEEFEVLLGWF